MVSKKKKDAKSKLKGALEMGGRVVGRFLQKLEENPKEKFERHLKDLDENIIYKVCLDTWLSVERYGEAAVRVASEFIYDLKSRNFVLNHDYVSLQQNKAEFRTMMDDKIHLVKNLFDYVRGFQGEQNQVADRLNAEWGAKYEELKKRNDALEKDLVERTEKFQRMQIENAKLSETVTTMEEEKAKIDQKVTEMEEEICSLKVQLKALEEDAGNIDLEGEPLVQDLRAEIDRLKSELDRSADEVASSRRDSRILTEQMEEKDNLLADEKARVAALEQELEMLRSNTSSGNDASRRLAEAAMAALEAEKAEMRREIDDLKDKVRKLEATEREHLKKTRDQRDTISELEGQLTFTEERIKELEGTLAKTLKELEDATNSAGMNPEELKKMEDKLRKEMQKIITAKDDEILELTEKNHKLETMLAELKLKLAELQQLLKNMGAGNAEVKAALEEAGLKDFISGDRIERVWDRLYQDFFVRAYKMAKMHKEQKEKRELLHSKFTEIDFRSSSPHFFQKPGSPFVKDRTSRPGDRSSMPSPMHGSSVRNSPTHVVHVEWAQRGENLRQIGVAGYAYSSNPQQYLPVKPRRQLVEDPSATTLPENEAVYTATATSPCLSPLTITNNPGYTTSSNPSPAPVEGRMFLGGGYLEQATGRSSGMSGNKHLVGNKAAAYYGAVMKNSQSTPGLADLTHVRGPLAGGDNPVIHRNLEGLSINRIQPIDREIKSTQGREIVRRASPQSQGVCRGSPRSPRRGTQPQSPHCSPQSSRVPSPTHQGPHLDTSPGAGGFPRLHQVNNPSSLGGVKRVLVQQDGGTVHNRGEPPSPHARQSPKAGGRKLIPIVTEAASGSPVNSPKGTNRIWSPIGRHNSRSPDERYSPNARARSLGRMPQNRQYTEWQDPNLSTDYPISPLFNKINADQDLQLQAAIGAHQRQHGGHMAAKDPLVRTYGAQKEAISMQDMLGDGHEQPMRIGQEGIDNLARKVGLRSPSPGRSPKRVKGPPKQTSVAVRELHMDVLGTKLQHASSNSGLQGNKLTRQVSLKVCGEGGRPGANSGPEGYVANMGIAGSNASITVDMSNIPAVMEGNTIESFHAASQTTYQTFLSEQLSAQAPHKKNKDVRAIGQGLQQTRNYNSSPPLLHRNLPPGMSLTMYNSPVGKGKEGGGIFKGSPATMTGEFLGGVMLSSASKPSLGQMPTNFVKKIEPSANKMHSPDKLADVSPCPSSKKVTPLNSPAKAMTGERESRLASDSPTNNDLGRQLAHNSSTHFGVADKVHRPRSRTQSPQGRPPSRPTAAKERSTEGTNLVRAGLKPADKVLPPIGVVRMERPEGSPNGR